MENKKIPYIFPLITDFLNKIHIDSHIRSKCNKNLYLWNHPTILEIADYCKSDKGSKINCGHQYIDYYEEILKSFIENQKNISILEIGLRNYDSHSIISFNLWNTIFSEKLYYVGFDSNIDLLKYNNHQNNVYIYSGNQTNINDLKQCNQHKYDLIIDDASHSSISQQIAFKTLWDNLNSDGMYCIESLHWQPSNDNGMKTKDLLLEWKSGNKISSQFIDTQSMEKIFNQIANIDFYPSKSNKWSEDIKKNAFCVITKK
jgi:hypothetical protein